MPLKGFGDLGAWGLGVFEWQLARGDGAKALNLSMVRVDVQEGVCVGASRGCSSRQQECDGGRAGGKR